MAYMHVCPKCRSFFKAKSTGKDLKCPKCSYQYLLDLKMDDEAWGTLNSVEKKIVIKARMSEEGLLDMMGAAAAPKASPAPDETAGKKVVKKVVKKKVVRKVVKKPADPAGAETAEKNAAVMETSDVEAEVKQASGAEEGINETAVKPEVNKEETKEEVNDSPTGQTWEDVFAVEEEREEKEAEIKEENKASSGAAGILASFLKGGKDKKEESDKKTAADTEGSEGEEGEKKEEDAAKPQKRPKVKLNKKYVAIVAGTMGALLLYLNIVTFVIPTFRIKSELPLLRTAETGDTVQFGKYKGQDEWTVLDRKGTKLLCMSNYAIYGQPYYDEGWDNSSLRKWFNSVYLNSSFNVFERWRITSTKEIREEFPDYKRDLGTDEPDKVFIISEGELLDYLRSHREAALNVNDGEIRAVCWIETK